MWFPISGAGRASDHRADEDSPRVVDPVWCPMMPPL